MNKDTSDVKQRAGLNGVGVILVGKKKKKEFLLTLDYLGILNPS